MNYPVYNMEWVLFWKFVLTVLNMNLLSEFFVRLISWNYIPFYDYLICCNIRIFSMNCAMPTFGNMILIKNTGLYCLHIFNYLFLTWNIITFLPDWKTKLFSQATCCTTTSRSGEYKGDCCCFWNLYKSIGSL